MKPEQKGNVFFILLFIFIVTLPYSFFVLFLFLIFSFFMKQNGKKIDFKKFLEKISSFNKSGNYTGAENIKLSQKSIENIVLKLLKVNYNSPNPNEKILNKSIENVLKANNVNDSIGKNEILSNAKEKFNEWKDEKASKNNYKDSLKIENNELMTIFEDNNFCEKSRKNFKESKKTYKNMTKSFSKTKKRTLNFKSIWDDYESVIDIMEKEK